MKILPPEDTLAINPPKKEPPKPVEPITWLYPNPASNSLFYYHHQDEFAPAIARIYSMSGQVVQKWDIPINDVTFEIDVANFASGKYILHVTDLDGEEIQRETFIKIGN